MDREDYIIAVFCVIDHFLTSQTKVKKIRQRGRPPKLHDSEVLTILVVGEFFGISNDKNI